MIKTIAMRILPQRLQKAVRLRMYVGNQQNCPCCGGWFRVFWPSGVDNSPNTLCPGCGSLERHRLLWLFVQANPQLLRPRQRVLHVAPEPLFERLLRKIDDVDYLSADLESPQAMVKMDLTDIQFPDDSFDAILCCHVLEHIPADAVALSELHRVLRPGGWAILQVPVDTTRDITYEDPAITSPQEREKHFGQTDHVRVYGRDYEDRLKQVGFSVRVESPQSHLGRELTSRYSLQENECVYLCSKDGTERNTK